MGQNTLIVHDPLKHFEKKPEYEQQYQTDCGRLKNRWKEDSSLTPEQCHDSFIMCRILVGFPVCLWCPDMKPLVMFPDWLDWCWRHMALIRLFNLSPVTMPRIRRLIEFTDGLRWYKTFERQFSNYLCMPTAADVCVRVCVCLHFCICVRECGFVEDLLLRFMTENDWIKL